MWSLVVSPRTQATHLATLISRMQQSADKVEQEILRAEELLAVVRRDTTHTHTHIHTKTYAHMHEHKQARVQEPCLLYL